MGEVQLESMSDACVPEEMIFPIVARILAGFTFPVTAAGSDCRRSDHRSSLANAVKPKSLDPCGPQRMPVYAPTTGPRATQQGSSCASQAHLDRYVREHLFL
jgi:hypothetical protein